MREFIIHTDTDAGEKGRSFRGLLLAHGCANALWTGGGGGDATRPAWAMIAVGDGESSPLMANIRMGERATFLGGKDKEGLEFLKSAGYKFVPQRHEVGLLPDGKPSHAVLWQVYLPALVEVDPAEQDVDGVAFVACPRASGLAAEDERTARWLLTHFREETYRQAEADAKMLETLRYVTRVAPVFAAYLDRRTRCPLIQDRRYYALVLASLMRWHHAYLGGDGSSRSEWGRSNRYTEDGAESVGLAPGLACHVSHEALEPILAETVTIYERDRW